MKIAILLYAAMVYHSAFEYKTGDPDSLFPVQSAIHDYSSPVIMTSPALLPFAEGFLISCNAGRPYSNEILTSGGSAIQYGSEDYGMQLSWNSFGADFYRENTFSLSAGYSIFSFLNAGVSGNLLFLKIETEKFSQKILIPETGFSLLLAPLPWINAAFTQTGISSLTGKQNEEIIYPERSAGILLKPAKGFSLAWNITGTAAESVNTFSVTANPAHFLSVKGGYCRETSSLAASLGILAADFYVSYGLRYHPYLGYTHSIGLTYSPEAEIESLHYGRLLLTSPKKKININTAEPEELKTIDGLSILSAERIVLYRRKIGPVTEKALMQIGLTGEEIKIVEANVYGLERTSRNKEGAKEFSSKMKKFVKTPPRNERIKTKFRELIGRGIPAFKAITYSELSESGHKDNFHNGLWNDSALTDDQKKIIEKICSK